jgi:YidC/Oxa1 family membrane protein insertase
MNVGFIFDSIVLKPLATILVAIYHALSFLGVPYSLGFSIIVLTIVIRLFLYPLITSQLKSSKKMQMLTPHLSRVKERHKGDAKRLQQETMRLYKEHGINPLAGCLPVLVQMPVIFGLYNLLQRIVSNGASQSIAEANKLVFVKDIELTSPWDLSFFGLPLGKGPSQLLPDFGIVVFLIPIATGLLQFVMSKMLVNPKPIEEKMRQSKEDKKEDFATAFQTQSLYIFPAMIGFFSYTFPIGLSLYWNTFTIFGIIQQYKILGWGGLQKWKEKIKR